MTVETVTVGFLRENCYIVGDGDGNAVVIDPGDEPEKILQCLEKGGLRCLKILITHGHFDHVGGVRAIQLATGAPMVMNPADIPCLSIDFDLNEPVADGGVVSAGGLSFRVLAAPGHSPGGVCYQTGGCIFTGDTLFAGSVGRSDFPGGSREELADSLRRLKELPGDLAVYPGHGESTTLRREKEENPYLQ